MPEEKKISGVQLFLLNMILPMFLQYGKEAAKASLQKAYDEDEQAKTLISTALVAVYPVIDIYLEAAATKSKTKIDDKVIDDLKGLMEELAEDNDIVLPNLDEGKEDD